MTIEDITKKFSEGLMGEIKGADEYLTMAQAAELLGANGLAKGLYSMAYDEFTHARFIHEMLVKHGIPVMIDTKARFSELKNRIENI